MLISPRKLVRPQPAGAAPVPEAAPQTAARAQAVPPAAPAGRTAGFVRKVQKAEPEAAPRAEAPENEANARLRRMIHDQVFSQIDPMKAALTSRENLAEQIRDLIRRICDENRFQLTGQEESLIAEQMLDEMLGIGPIEPLLSDETVTDILVNGAGKVFVERFGKLELTPITFIDEQHVFNIAQRIAARVGRRIDEANPMVDARLADGSRVNVITHPLALDGTSISIRKFSKRKRNLEELAQGGALTVEMVELLGRAVKARLNIVVSGGTGAGKTTLLNALSFKIGQEERVVTIEDAAELQLRNCAEITFNL